MEDKVNAQIRSIEEQSVPWTDEALLRQLTEGVGAVLWVGSPDWGEVLHVSSSYETVWGRSCASLSEDPMSWLDAVIEEDRPAVLAAISAKAAGDLSVSAFPEYRIVRPDGTQRWILAQSFPMLDERGEVCRIAGIAQDITERKRGEEQLRRYEQIVASSRDMMALLDTDFVYLACNEAYVAAFGKTKQELVGHTVPEVFGEEFFAAVIKPNAQHCLAGHGARYQDWFDFPVQGRRYMDIAYSPYLGQGGAVEGFVVVGRDITEQKLAERSLRDSEERLRAWLENSPVCSKVLDLDFNLQYMSSSGLKALKLDDLSQVRGKPYPFDFLSESFRIPMASSLGKAKATGEVVAQEACMVDTEGNEMWFDSTIVPVNDDDGRVDYLIVVSINTTERKQLERRLRQSEKMDAIGQLAGGIAHDFNNQLTGIINYAGILLSQLEDEDERSCATRILRAAERGASLTAQLLAFSREGKLRTTAVDIHKTIAEVASLLAHSIDKRVQIQLHLAANPSTTTGDPAQLQSALLNLGINAGDAMAEGGELVFDTEVVNLNEEFSRSLPYDVAPGRYLRISVADTGVGMDEETLGHIFEPFFTTKGVGEGTGLGLAAVYGTVRSHEGAIEVQSEPGQGSTFVLHLPLTESPVGRDRDGPGRRQCAEGTARILLVDDEECVRISCARILGRLGYEVVACEDGAEAVEYYRQSWEDVDLVLLDMMMPRMNGRDAFLAMREINPDLKTLLLSGFGKDRRIQAILDEGVLGFIQKPFPRDVLTERVAEALRE
ncbi:MAG: PAS domain-containing protein [Victivallales bacterium]|nr:PAS domain-containing protein [Victivallales bacterium]